MEEWMLVISVQPCVKGLSLGNWNILDVVDGSMEMHDALWLVWESLVSLTSVEGLGFTRVHTIGLRDKISNHSFTCSMVTDTSLEVFRIMILSLETVRRVSHHHAVISPLFNVLIVLRLPFPASHLLIHRL